MDKKELSLLTYYYNKVTSDSFDEKDVYAFLILLRDHTEKDTPAREFGDFIAHRERDRGAFMQKLLKQAELCNEIIFKNIQPITQEQHDKIFALTNEVYTFDKIKDSFNKAVRSPAIAFKEFTDIQIKNILVCIISLFHEVNFVKNNHLIGTLSFCLEKNYIWLRGMIGSENGGDISFPALGVQQNDTGTEETWYPTENVSIEVAVIDGQVKIKR
jgi:hypothetical protein